MLDIENYLLQFVLPYCKKDSSTKAKVKEILKQIRSKSRSTKKLSKQEVEKQYIEIWQAIFELLKVKSSLRAHSAYMPVKMLMMNLDHIIQPKLQRDCFQLTAKKQLDKSFMVNYFRLTSCKDFETIQLNQMDSDYIQLHKPKKLDQ
ncbi:hypothetical protein ACG9XX_14690 [Acinetobacter baumannii]|uniref:Uncharacterized protein n=1 Tax=Acinetobacter baumannii TaxID=470 RepID=A0A9Q8L393_ACIBA|nr:MULTISPECIES: hypothetical protein [Acinetobacter]MDC4314389.1 hypothetical protein [Acinetobacter baumannii]MDQ8920142.1 hypothetical protein [Acinetobacter baumannii]MDQ8951074.1 hypothetical protein [Acinetobacter baumannii]MDQ8965213.1 hypothetical protein [Acinetobacter baumannii]MDQ8968949.1 hypothetical protein [Acinetobacter baumannii]